MFTQTDINNINDHIEELKGIIQRLKEENTLSSTTSSQKEANAFMIDKFTNSIKLYESKARYIKLELDNPTPPQPSILDKRLYNPSSPQAFMHNNT
ncbi:hypothetical protein [Priestia megaterium]|uniref:hypothetical protein n=1 Tax=Priestia megaterium TaxID=1404 RepID=UPI0033955D12